MISGSEGRNTASVRKSRSWDQADEADLSKLIHVEVDLWASGLREDRKDIDSANPRAPL